MFAAGWHPVNGGNRRGRSIALDRTLMGVVDGVYALGWKWLQRSISLANAAGTGKAVDWR